MKKLINVNPWVWTVTTIVVLISIISIVLLFVINVEEAIDANLMVDNLHSNSLIVDSNVAYKVSTGDQITLKINDDYYYCKIGKIFWDTDNNPCLEVLGLNFDLIPGTQINVKIIYDTHSFASVFFS